MEWLLYPHGDPAGVVSARLRWYDEVMKAYIAENLTKVVEALERPASQPASSKPELEPVEAMEDAEIVLAPLDWIARGERLRIAPSQCLLFLSESASKRIEDTIPLLMKGTIGKWSLFVSSSDTELQSVRDFITFFVSLETSSLHELLTAVLEATENCRMHAYTEPGPVLVSVTLERGGVIVEVRDWGAGFNTSRLKELQCSRPIKPSGRGIYLMCQLVDELSISSSPGGGTVVRLSKKIP